MLQIGLFQIIHLHCNIDVTNQSDISYINIAMKMNNSQKICKNIK